MRFDINGENAARCLYVRTFLNGVEITQDLQVVDTVTGYIRRLKRDAAGSHYREHPKEGCACDRRIPGCEVAYDEATVPPASLRVIFRENCPPELRW